MLKNYLKIAWRNLWRNKVFSLINIAGLALGITAFVFILQYVSYEYSINRFHKNLPDLYRVLTETEVNGKQTTYASQPPALATIAQENYSEVKRTCRIAGNAANGVATIENKQSGKLISFRQDNIAYVDGTFFEMFSFPILHGKASELYKPNTVAISKTQSQKYFSSQNPIGKTLQLHNQFGKASFMIVAVYADFPTNSDIQFDMLFSLQTMANQAYIGYNDWAKLDGFDSNFLATFIQLQPKANHKALEKKLSQYRKKARPKSVESYRLQPLQNVHLAQSLSDYYDTTGNLALVYSLAGVSILILTIAWLNYVNLATATSLKRAKEVGIRKVIGANRRQLIFQFLGESFLLNICGFLSSLVLIEVLQGFFNWLIDKPLELSILEQNWFWLWGIGLLLLGTVASGAYTAFVLSSFKPTQTLKGAFAKSKSGVWLRKSLVVFQFSISITLIASTFVLYSQLRYMQNKDLGLNTSQLLVIKGAEVGRDSTYAKKAKVFTQKLEASPFVKEYAVSGAVPSRWYNFSIGGMMRANAPIQDNKTSYAFAIVSHQYFPIYQIKLVAGKNFNYSDCNRSWIKVEKLIINEKACTTLGFASPETAIGQKLKWGERIFQVLGVVKDYHHESVQNQISPMIFYPQTHDDFYTIRLSSADMQGKLAELESLYNTTFAGNPFEYFFVDDNYNRSYQFERQYSAIFTNASFLAIFIACLGLFGLATFTVEARTKEIGIRKVLGASAQSIIALISKDFLRLVLIAFAIATPLAWYISQQWLQNFAYRTPVSWWIFAFAGGLSILVALFTITYQAIQASRKNPVESLRYE